MLRWVILSVITQFIKNFKLKPGHLLIRKNNTNTIVKYSKIKPTFIVKFDDNFILIILMNY